MRLTHRGLALFYLLYGGFYVGLWFADTRQTPVVFGTYSRSHLLILGLATLPLFLPLLWGWAVRKIGLKHVLFALVPALLLGLVMYLGASIWHYNTTRRLFEPFLQYHPPVLKEKVKRRAPDDPRVVILVLGGSTSIHYPKLLEKKLREKLPAQPVAFLNAATVGFSVKNSLINYVTYADAWQPDVVLCLHGINDLVRSFNAPHFAVGPYSEKWTHYYHGARKAANPPSLESETLGKLADLWFRTLRVREADVPLEGYRSLPAFREHLDRLAHYIQANGSQPIFLTQPTIYRPDQTEAETRKLNFQIEMCLERYSYWRQEYPSPASLARAMAAYNQATEEAARAAGIPCLDAAAAIPKDLTHFTDDCHFTPAGLEKLADFLAAELAAKKLVVKGSAGKFRLASHELPAK